MATTIMLQKETRDLLKFYGRKNETYDEIIKKLIKFAEKKKFFEENEQILKKEKFHALEDL